MKKTVRWTVFSCARVGKSTALLEPLAEAIGRHVLSAEAIFADDTPVRMLAPGTGKTQTARLWTHARDERSRGGKAPPAAWYRFSGDRKGQHPKDHLARFRGWMHADGHAGLEDLYRSGAIREVVRGTQRDRAHGGNARYNWQHDELSVAQTEIARLWSVDPRTVKREMAVFRERGWLVERRAAARGRVTLFGLGIERILDDTRPVWEKVGPDLISRLVLPEPKPAIESEGRVIPFPNAPLPPENTLWGWMSRELQARNAGMFRAWFAGLQASVTPDELILQTSGLFQANYIKTHLAGLLEHCLTRHAPGLRLSVR